MTTPTPTRTPSRREIRPQPIHRHHRPCLRARIARRVTVWLCTPWGRGPRRVAVVAVAAAAVLGLTACGESYQDPSQDMLTPATVTVDGRKVLCVIYHQGTGKESTGSVSCDWGERA